MSSCSNRWPYALGRPKSCKVCPRTSADISVKLFIYCRTLASPGSWEHSRITAATWTRGGLQSVTRTAARSIGEYLQAFVTSRLLPKNLQASESREHSQLTAALTVEGSGKHSVTEIDSCNKQRVKRRPAAPGLSDHGKESSWCNSILINTRGFIWLEVFKILNRSC